VPSRTRAEFERKGAYLQDTSYKIERGRREITRESPYGKIVNWPGEENHRFPSAEQAIVKAEHRSQTAKREKRQCLFNLMVRKRNTEKRDHSDQQV
jgi:hypothetical protein